MSDDPPIVPVLAIDDDPGFLLLLERHLEGDDGQRFAFQRASDAQEARARLGQDNEIQVILLDHRLGGTTDGLGLLKHLRDGGDDRPVIMMTAYGDEYLAAAMAKNGADGYLVKSDIYGDRLARIIDRVLSDWRGNRAFRQECADIRQRVRSLTPREREVMDLIVSGLMNREIADKLYRSEKTIKIHRSNVMAKMQATTPADLVRLLLTAEPNYPATRYHQALSSDGVDA